MYGVDTNQLIPYEVVRFCSVECRLQMSGENSVLWMIDAWLYANDFDGKSPTVDDVLTLGRLIEPFDNIHGFRRCSVQIGSDIKNNWQEVPRQMVSLMENQDRLTPAEFFKEFEEIHPFVDGNGRTGALLFNWLNRTLNNLDWPPNYWSDSRRIAGHGAPR